MIFQEVKNMLVNREYAEIDNQMINDLINAVSVVMIAGAHGEYLPQEYIDLRDWVYTRIAWDLKYKRTGYLNDHCCIGIIWGIIRTCDESLGIEKWEEYYGD